MNEDKRTRHRRLRRRVQVLHAVSALLLLAVLVIFSDRLPAAVLASVAGDTVVFLVVGVLLAGVSAPWAWLRDVLLERRFGTDAPGGSSWLWRYLWQWGLSMAATLPIWLTFQLLQRIQPWAVVAGTTLLIVVGSVVLMALAPSFVVWSPRVAPLGDEAVTGRLHALVSRAGLRVGGVYAWREGPFVTEPNAALLGAGRWRRLLLSDALLAQFKAEEVDVVVAHELGHHAHGHLWRRLKLTWVVSILAVLAAQLSALTRAAVLDVPLADPRALPWCVLAAGLVAVAARPRLLAASRAHEVEADLFALEVTGRPDVLERVLERLGAHYRAAPEPSPFEAAFFLTHPPVRERVERARAWRARDMTRTAAVE